MNRAQDRRRIVPLLAEHFPDLATATSDEVGAFLDQFCGVETDPQEDNASAFDRWRKALAVLGYEGVWGHTPASEMALAARGKEMADKAREAHAKQLETAAQIVADFEAVKAEQAKARAAALKKISNGNAT